MAAEMITVPKDTWGGIIKAATWWRDIAVGDSEFPLVYNRECGNWHCLECRGAALQYEDITHTTDCKFAQAQAAIERAEKEAKA